MPYNMQHNAEPEAVDLLMEVEQLSKLIEFSNENNYERVCLYLLSCAQYAADTEEMTNAYTTAYRIYIKLKQYPLALRVAQKINNTDYISEVMSITQDKVTLRQMAYMLGRQRNPWETEDEDLARIVSNERLSEHFKNLGRDLDVLEPKTAEHIYKSHLEERKHSRADKDLDSAYANLAVTYVNGFINAGFGKDLLMMNDDGKDNWIYKNKDTGMQAAAASMGLLLLWDTDEGLSQIDKYLDATDDNIVAGACMAVGLINSGIKSEVDPAFALLTDKLESAKRQNVIIGCLMGLSFAYAGSAREDLLEIITPYVLDSSNTIEL